MSANWRTIAELIGIVAIVASLLFVGHQIQQDQEIAIADTHTSVTSNLGNVAALVGTAPELWRRGLDGEALSIEDEIQFLATAAAVEAHMFDMYIRFLRLGIGNPETYALDFSYALYVHPGLRRIFAERREHRKTRAAAFTEEGEEVRRRLWEDQIASRLEELDTRQPALPSKKQYVFWSGS